MNFTPGSVESIRETGDEALKAKYSLHHLGYYHDDFVDKFYTKKTKQIPVINRGYFTRVYMIHKIVETFLSHGENHQIVSLGCGMDTLYFNLMKKKCKILRYVELDYLQTVQNKIRLIKSSGEVMSMFVGEMKTEDNDKLDIDNYHLHPVDLTKTNDLLEILDSIGMNIHCPTLFLSECVLIYLPTESSDSIIKLLNQKYKNNMFVIYEQVNPFDSFGEMMIQNLISRGCPLMSIHKYPTIELYKQRLNGLGYNHVEIETMNTIYYEVIESDEIKRISKIELFDEFEEFHLFQSHYIIAIGCNLSKLPSDFEFLRKHPKTH